MLLQEFLRRSAERFPDKTALVATSKRLTYCEIDSSANRLARFMRDSAEHYGERVVIFLENSPEAVISIFGSLRAGAVFVPVNPGIKSDKLSFILNNCRATTLVTHSGKWAVARKAAASSDSLKLVIVVGDTIDNADPQDGPACRVCGWHEALGTFPGGIPDIRTIDIDLASLVYTSGTTGNPKGVMLTHTNMVSASTSITTYLENTEDDIILSTLPLSFDYGLYQVLMSAQFGGTVILEKKFLYPYAVINLLKKEKATGFPIVPTMAAILLQMEDLKNESFDNLRYITNTAAALPESHIRGLQAIFPGTDIYSMYGLTECKRVSYLPPSELERRPGSVGKGMPNEQVYLVDEEGGIITEPGREGELVVRGANVMMGYWELPEETREVLRPGPHPWERVLYTGDIFRQDEEGYLYFIARKDNIIKSRGEKVSPGEVENVIYGIEGVVEAAVVGVPDEILGEAVKAYIVTSRGAGILEKQVIAYCRRHLEDFMVPKYVEFVESLPKTSSGKITKKNL